MKEFNLEAAKAGAEVMTKSGLSVRIVCWDRKGSSYSNVGLIYDCDDHVEFAELYNNEGKSINCTNKGWDLVMKPIKREGYILFDDVNSLIKSKHTLVTDAVHDEYVEAQGYKTVKLEWEE